MFKATSAILQLFHGENKLIFTEMMMRSTVYQTNTLSWILHSASSLKQHSTDRHVAPLGHIILISSQSVFDLSPYCCVIRGEVTNINFIVVGLIQSGIKPRIYHTRIEHANHYTTDTIKCDGI